MISEDVLLGLPLARQEPCSCGETISLVSGDSVERVVAFHNESEAHLAYRSAIESRVQPETRDRLRERWRERQRACRARRVAAGLTTDGLPRIGRRRVASWTRGPYHLAEPGPNGLCLHGCGRRVNRNGHGGWRHRPPPTR